MTAQALWKSGQVHDSEGPKKLFWELNPIKQLEAACSSLRLIEPYIDLAAAHFPDKEVLRVVSIILYISLVTKCLSCHFIIIVHCGTWFEYQGFGGSNTYIVWCPGAHDGMVCSASVECDLSTS